MHSIVYSNGIVERLQRTVKDQLDETEQRSLVQIQERIDRIRKWYNNEERTHSGKYCCGKTPMQTFTDSLHLAKGKMLG